MANYCSKCMRELDAYPCKNCGFDGTYIPKPHQLPAGTILLDRYVVGAVIGQGGFGITYVGRDTKLDLRIAIKEYFPSGFVIRNTDISNRIDVSDSKQNKFVREGKAQFLDEAKALASVHECPGIVDVRDYFEENNTAYIVMEYLDGQDINSYLKNNSMSVEETLRLMRPVISSLKEVHSVNRIHRDISPDNLMVMNDGMVKLMDFGAARTSISPSVDEYKTVSVILKMGYAPEEQYRKKGNQGPWTDIYSLCATMYRCITGKAPDDALQRLIEDEIKWPSELGISISPQVEDALKKGMAIKASDRFQTMEQLEVALYGGKITEESESKEKAPIKNKKNKSFIIVGICALLCVLITSGVILYTQNNPADRKKHSTKVTEDETKRTKKTKETEETTEETKSSTEIVLLESNNYENFLWGNYNLVESTDSINNYHDVEIKKFDNSDSVVYNISDLPVSYELNPELVYKGETVILMKFVDQINQTFVIWGTCKADDKYMYIRTVDSEFKDWFLSQNPESVSLSPSMFSRIKDEESFSRSYSFTEDIVFEYSRDDILQIFQLKSKDGSSNSRYDNRVSYDPKVTKLIGNASDESQIKDDITGMYIDVEITEEGRPISVTLANGRKTIDAYVKKESADSQRINVYWNQVREPYNGRSRIVESSDSVVVSYISTYPYGFIIGDGDNYYFYQDYKSE